MDVEQKFLLAVEGKRIRRGPCLTYITVFKGPAGLVLDNEMEVTGVFRDGQAEGHFEKIGKGQRSLYCGSQDVLLEPGLYEYKVTYTTVGEWKFQGREAAAAFDFGGPFRGFGIDAANLRIVFPDGVRILRHSPSVQGFRQDPHHVAAALDGNELLVKIADPLAANHAMFINAVWMAEGFSRAAHWMQVMKQHPKLPLALFAEVLLLWILFLLLRKFLRAPASAAAGAA